MFVFITTIIFKYFPISSFKAAKKFRERICTVQRRDLSEGVQAADVGAAAAGSSLPSPDYWILEIRRTNNILYFLRRVSVGEHAKGPLIRRVLRVALSIFMKRKRWLVFILRVISGFVLLSSANTLSKTTSLTFHKANRGWQRPFLASFHVALPKKITING